MTTPYINAWENQVCCQQGGSPRWLPGSILLIWLASLPHASTCVYPKAACSAKQDGAPWGRRPLLHKGPTSSCAALQTSLQESWGNGVFLRIKKRYGILIQLVIQQEELHHTIFCMNLKRHMTFFLLKRHMTFFHLMFMHRILLDTVYKWKNAEDRGV